jgi:hypothetical protein
MHLPRLLIALSFSLTAISPLHAEEAAQTPAQTQDVAETDGWLHDYLEAYRQAKAEKKYLFVVFEEPGKEGKLVNFAVEDDEHVFVRVSTDAKLSEDAKQTIRQHNAFHWLASRSGVAIIDLKNDAFSGDVVSVMPEYKLTSSQNVIELLNLPPGTITQRTFVWAIRTHRAGPQSTDTSTADPSMMNYAARYASLMVNKSMGSGRPHLNGSMWVMPAQQHGFMHYPGTEILSTTWPNQPLGIVEGAEALVDTWHDAYGGRRTGHWGACANPCSSYGYDMAYDHENSMWYGIGIMQGCQESSGGGGHRASGHRSGGNRGGFFRRGRR